MAEYYLATDGDDANSGSDSAPFGSLQGLMGTLSAGDTGYVRGGTYTPTGFADGSGQQGTESDPIVLQAVAGEDVVFDFGGDSYGGLRLWNCAYWELRGFTVRNAPSYGVYLFGGTHHSVVESITVDGSGGDSNTSGAGIYLYNAPDNVVRNCVSRNNYDPSSGGGNADGFASEGSPRSLFADCVSHGNSDDGFDFWQAENDTIRRCVAFDNGYAPDGTAAGDGNGFKLGGGDTSGNHRVERCVSYRNAVQGFHYNEADLPVDVYNCTAWDNPTNFWFADVAHVLRNNLSAEGSESLGSAVDDAANSWNLGIDQPSFASTDPSSPDFLRLSTDSPAIDAGTDVGLSFAGEAPDLGAYETGADDPGSGGTGDTGTTGDPTLRVATATGDGGVAFETGTLSVYDGSEWVRPPVSYYDGSSFVTISDGQSDTSDPTDSAVVDGFESGDLAAYSGDTTAFAVTTDQVAAGTYALGSTGSGGDTDWKDIRSTAGLDTYVPHGSTVRVKVFLTGTGDSAIVRFGVGGSDNWIGAGYNANEGGIQLSEAVAGSWSQIGTGSLSPAAGEWMEWEISWGVDADDAVSITCYDASGAEIGSGSATASDHRSDDGVGFEYTFQYGGSGPVYFDDLRLV